MQKRSLVQMDSRGRILLPKELREHQLYEIESTESNSSRIVLHALRSERVEVSEPSGRPFSTRESWQFIQEKIFTKLRGIAAHHKIQSIVAYGSYPRGTAFNTSDLDLAIFGENLSRRTIENAVDNALAGEIKILESRRIFLVPSTVFVSFTQSSKKSTLAYSIATDGLAILDAGDQYKKWKQEVLKSMKALGVRRVYRGLSEVWETPHHG